MAGEAGCKAAAAAAAAVAVAGAAAAAASAAAAHDEIDDLHASLKTRTHFPRLPKLCVLNFPRLRLCHT